MAEATSDRGDVHRGIATTDDHDTLADMAQATVIECLQKGCRGNDVGCVGITIDRQRAACLCPKAEEYGVEILADLLHGDVRADAALQLGRDAQVENTLDFGVEDITRGAVAGNTVAHHAAKEFVVVEDGHGMALQSQLVGHGKAGGAATDDRDLLAGLLFGLLELQVVLDGVLAEVVLDRVDADVVFNLIAVAAGFARGGADTAHHGGQRIGFRQPSPGIFLPGHDRLAIGAHRWLFDAANDVQIAADVLTRRAGALAWRSGLNVGRTLVGPTCLEDVVLPTLDLGVAFLVAAERQRGVLGIGRH